MSSEFPCISMNLIEPARYSSGIQSPVSTCPPDWAYPRNSCVACPRCGLPTERSLASSVMATRREALTREAARLFAERGFHGTSMVRSRRRSASRRARSTRSPGRSRSSCSETMREGANAFHTALDAMPEDGPPPTACWTRCAGIFESSPSSSTSRPSSHGNGATSRASTGTRSSPSGGGTRNAGARLFREGVESGDLRTDLDAGAATLLLLSAANWAYTWLEPAATRRPRRSVPGDPRRRHPRVRNSAVSRLLIVNPFASGVDEHRLAAVQAALPAGTETRLTTCAGEATEIARAAGEVEAIYVLGGDGTYNEVLNGIRSMCRSDSFREAGRACCRGHSDFRAIRSTWRSAWPRASATIGLGRVNGRRFGFSAGLGFDAELVRRVDELGRSPDGRRPGDITFMRVAASVLRDAAGASSSRSRSKERDVRVRCSSRTARPTRTRAWSRSTSSRARASRGASRTSRP